MLCQIIVVGCTNNNHPIIHSQLYTASKVAEVQVDKENVTPLLTTLCEVHYKQMNKNGTTSIHKKCCTCHCTISEYIIEYIIDTPVPSPQQEVLVPILFGWCHNAELPGHRTRRRDWTHFRHWEYRAHGCNGRCIS